MPDVDETIVAQASARGGALRGIVRLSGPCAWPIVSRVMQSALPERSRDLVPLILDGQLALPMLHSPVPASLILCSAPRSYTGQDLVEVHTIGSPPIVQHVLDRFIAGGARLAVPGEFTMRAFLNGKLDLTEAEAILGLIDAADPVQADAALRQLAGGIARPIQQLRDQLLDLLAELEAGLDFAEEDLTLIDRNTVSHILNCAAAQMEQLQIQMAHRATSLDRPRVALLGKPNAGKSSLFNALLGRTAAIVSHTAGTTRDYLTATLELRRSTVELIDTAGIEQPTDPITEAAQSARDQSTKTAGLILWCHDSSMNESGNWSVPPGDFGSAERIVVFTKCDLLKAPEPVPVFRSDDHHSRGELPRYVRVSAIDGTGLPELQRAIDEWASGISITGTPVVASTAARCRHAIQSAAQSLRRAIDQAGQETSNELVALEIRLALDDFGQVVGAVYTDDILDRVFSRFCIGK